MKENIKLATKIGGKAVVKWLLIFMSGNLVTLTVFLIALFNNIGLAGGGHGQVVALFMGLLTNNICAFILIFGAPAFIALYFVIANKVSIQNVIYLLCKSKAGDYISEKVGAIASRITDKEGWRREISSKAILKARLLQVSKDDPNTSKLQRKVIGYGFEKISLDDVDFQDENVKLSTILQNKFHNFITDTTQPSLTLFWGLILIQVVLLTCSLIIN
ncbi:hypothetical protein LVD17_14750 [Fulvivirga ulvae]|uniref:hypothetical protein n=1 Tax=Fulvivirga ulvae TaxID=2904245 RepID=UPI001F1F6422|nr:hypothetical protein [Fulvivirga ulvae]UII29558.1 hypothetical protein LVD17_14750 [Fulvivirga ulvae]